MDVIYFVLLFFYAQFVGRLQKKESHAEKTCQTKKRSG